MFVIYKSACIVTIVDDSTLSGGAGGSDEDKDEYLNIFSLASGHLYERLMRIMMRSMVKVTKAPVKFWLLKNYLSPEFKVGERPVECYAFVVGNLRTSEQILLYIYVLPIQ